MAQLTLSDLIRVKSKDELMAEFQQVLSANGFSGTDFNTFSDCRAIMEMESTALEDLWLTVLEIAQGMHLDTAVEGWLTLKAKSDYQIDRVLSQFTRGRLLVSLRTGVTSATINAGDLEVNDNNGHFYQNINGTPLSLTTATPSGYVEIEALSPGQDYNVASNTITAVSKGPVTVSVNNIGNPTKALLVAPNVPTLVGLTGKTFSFTIANSNGGSGLLMYTFPGPDPANITALIAEINAAITAAPSVNGLVIAKQVGTNFALETTASGPNVAIILGMPAVVEMGFPASITQVARGGYESDQPASIYGAYLQGPFNVNGTTLTLKWDSGAGIQTQTHTFNANYANMTLLVNAVNASTSFVYGTKFAIFENDNGRLKISTIKTGGIEKIELISPSTSALLLGLEQGINGTGVGSTTWLSQEGLDEELDENLRNRCRSKWGILGAGTKDAFLTWAREANTKVQKVVVFSNLFAGVPKAGAVSIYLATLNGTVDASVVTSVYNYILPKMPMMSDLYISSVVSRIISYKGTITLRSKFNTDATKSAIRSNIQRYSQSLQIAEKVYKKKIEREILIVDGVVDCNLTAPGGDIPINDNELATIQEDLVTPLEFIIVP